MRKSKWVEGAAPGEPASLAAREALRARLRTVDYYLPLAAYKSARDVEYVHQLRVSTRRAVSVLHVFRPLLSEKHADYLDRQLKRIRRAAGEARDLDVLGRRVAEWSDAQPSASRAALVGRIESCRDDAQSPIRKLTKKLRHKGFAAKCDKIVKRVYWRGVSPEPSFGDVAADCLRLTAEPFFTAGASDIADLTALHCFRITAKHLRYSMEIFAAAFDHDFRSGLYPLIEDVQTRLGEIHDHAAALARFQAWQAEWNDQSVAPALVELADMEKGALARTRQNFIRWWTPERAADLRQHFDHVLASHLAARDEKYA